MPTQGFGTPPSSTGFPSIPNNTFAGQMGSAIDVNGMSGGLWGVSLGTGLVNEAGRGIKIVAPITNITKGIGYLGSGVNIGIHGYNLYHDRSGENWARLGVNGFIVGLNLVNLAVPGLGTGLSIGVGYIEMAGGFNWFYNMF